MSTIIRHRLATLELSTDKLSFLEDKGLLDSSEKELTKIVNALEEFIDFTLSDLWFDAQSTDLSVGVDNRFIDQSLREFDEEFGN
jgi:hypothetical protein